MTANVRDALSAATRRQIPIFRAAGPVRSEALFLDISLFYFCFYFFFCYKVDASCIRVDAGWMQVDARCILFLGLSNCLLTTLYECVIVLMH